MKKFLSIFAFVAMTFSAMACCNEVDVNGKWNIVKVNGEEISVTADAETPYIEFNTEEGKIHGYSGVNIMNGSYTLEGKALTFGNTATTMMAGPAENMAVESAVLGALAKVAKVSVEGESLLLLDAEGNTVMELSK